MTHFMISGAVVLLMMAACSSGTWPSPQSSPPLLAEDVAIPASAAKPSARPDLPTLAADASAVPPATLAPTKVWLAVLQKTPYPYTTPLPPPIRTMMDGIYVKFEPKEGTPVPCRRCPDYLPEGGLWKLNLDRGMYRIFHEATGWFSVGSFTVSGGQLKLFNDPTCIDTVGSYEWELAEGGLKLKVIADACQVDRRGRSFANLAWTSCQPPNAEAAVTGHWPPPPGCDQGN